jgi:pilus assembly protein Flp/PilA
MEQLMSRLMELSKSAAAWLRVTSNRGVSAIEYGLLAALIALVIIAAVTTLGTNLSGVFSTISSSV